MLQLLRSAPLAVIVLAMANGTFAAPSELPKVRDIFENAARPVVSETNVPVYVPVSLQSLDVWAKDGCAFAEATSDHFEISLYGTTHEYPSGKSLPCEQSSAGFIASIHGEVRGAADFSRDHGMQKVKLRNGLVGWFQPVSCGGSCAPATLYWQTKTASYWLQLRFPSSQEVSSQLREITAAVNALTLLPSGR